MSDDKQLPEIQQDSWPTEFIPSRAKTKYTDEQLSEIIDKVAHTQMPIHAIVAEQGIKMANFYEMQHRWPRLAEAYEIAKSVRREVLNDQMLEIADAPLKGDKDEVAVELAHRRLRMQARKDLAKTSKPGKGMEKFSVNIGSKTEEDGKHVTVVQVNYGDK